MIYFLLLLTLAVNGLKCYCMANKKSTLSLVDDILDFLPILILVIPGKIYANSLICSVFIIGICYANSIIRHNSIIGAILYLITYLTSSLMYLNPPSDTAMIITIAFDLIILSIGIIAVLKKLTNKAIIWGGVSYAIIVFSFLLLDFFQSFNLGFIALILGDILLALNFVFKKNWLYFISNSLFYIGVCISPLALV